MRIVNATLVLLGETPTPAHQGVTGAGQEMLDVGENLGDMPLRARTWMKQNDLAISELEQVFNVVDGVAEVIAPHMPGKNKKEQTLNAYILTGVTKMISTGNSSFSDSEARELCVRSGCYDSGNHAATMKDKGNEFAGTKDKGWMLTAPGLKRAAELIKELSKSGE